MYKEYREMSRTDAVEQLYQDMAARHRARFRSINVCGSNLTQTPKVLQFSFRSLKSWRSRRLPISAALISSSLLRRTSNSHSHIACRNRPAKRYLPHADHQLFTEHCCIYENNGAEIKVSTWATLKYLEKKAKIQILELSFDKED